MPLLLAAQGFKDFDRCIKQFLQYVCDLSVN